MSLGSEASGVDRLALVSRSFYHVVDRRTARELVAQCVVYESGGSRRVHWLYPGSGEPVLERDVSVVAPVAPVSR